MLTLAGDEVLSLAGFMKKAMCIFWKKLTVTSTSLETYSKSSFISTTTAVHLEGSKTKRNLREIMREKMVNVTI